MLICMPTPPGRIAPTAAAAPAHASPEPLGLEIADVVSRLRRAARGAGRDGKLPGGLSVAQLELLSCLADSPGARPSQRRGPLRLAPSSVATLVQGLRRAGLVSRTGGQRDRRTASLLLTPDGAAIVSSWQEVNEQILQAAITSLGPASRDALDAALPGLRELTGAVDALADDLVGGLGPPADDSRTGVAGSVIVHSWASRRLCHYAYRRDLRRHRALRGRVPVAGRPGVDHRGDRRGHAAAGVFQRGPEQQHQVPPASAPSEHAAVLAEPFGTAGLVRSRWWRRAPRRRATAATRRPWPRSRGS